MSQADQFRQYAEESKPPRRKIILSQTGVSHGGFETLAGARQFACEKGLRTWDIFHGNLIELVDELMMRGERRSPHRKASRFCPMLAPHRRQWRAYLLSDEATHYCEPGPAFLARFLSRGT